MMPIVNPVEAATAAIQDHIPNRVPTHGYSPHYRGCASICGVLIDGAMCCRPRSHPSHPAPVPPVVTTGPIANNTPKAAPVPEDDWYDWQLVPVPKFQKDPS